VVGLRKDGSSFPLDLAVSEYRTANGRYFTGVVRDITERKRIEQELQQRAFELQVQNDRKDEFLAMLGHELRNPLSAVRSSAELLRLRPDDPPTVARAQGVISRQVGYLVRLVDDLLDIGRLNRGRLRLRLEPGDLRDMVRQAVEATRAYFQGRENRLLANLPEESLPLLAGPARITQVVANLLHNASKFTGPDDQVTVSASRTHDIVELRVEDTGAGIAPSLLPKIFDLYERGPRWDNAVQAGLGIGLKLVKTLVEMHGGHAEAQSQGLGRGSCFRVTLPLRADMPASNDAGNAGWQASLRLLIVDDNADAASSLAEVLRWEGHDVRETHDGACAIDIASQWRPEVVLLDIGLPGLDGYEVARRMRRLPELKSTRLIALTGTASHRTWRARWTPASTSTAQSPSTSSSLAVCSAGVHCRQRASRPGVRRFDATPRGMKLRHGVPSKGLIPIGLNRTRSK
jgi:signal transduction histidine kinase